MSTFTNGTKWTGTINPDTKTSKLTIPVGSKYNAKDIEVNVQIDGIKLKNGESFWVQTGTDTTTRWIFSLDTSGNLTVTDANYQ